jgi:hypothetical protein
LSLLVDGYGLLSTHRGEAFTSSTATPEYLDAICNPQAFSVGASAAPSLHQVPLQPISVNKKSNRAAYCGLKLAAVPVIGKSAVAAQPSDPANMHFEPKAETGTTTTMDRIPDPAVPDFGAEWDAAWEKNLLAHALERVLGRIDERQFQIFDFCVMKGWPPADVAQTLGITAARVYLTKHRVSALLKKEVRRLEKMHLAESGDPAVEKAGTSRV